MAMIRNRLGADAYTDGVVRIYSVTGAVMAQTQTLKETLRYKERTVGIQRYTAMLQTGVTVQYVLRCPLRRSVSAQDIAVPNDGKRYRIVQVQVIEDAVTPAMDLTLEEVRQDYGAK